MDNTIQVSLPLQPFTAMHGKKLLPLWMLLLCVVEGEEFHLICIHHKAQEAARGAIITEFNDT